MTQENIAAYVAYFAAKGEEVSPEAAEGAIAMWQEGKGELIAELVNGSELFRPIVEQYFAALSLPVPETVGEPLVKIPEPPTQE